MTITVDINGDVIQLPNVENNNDFLESNPALLDQVKNIVKKINLPNANRVSSDIDQYHKQTLTLLEQFGDIQYLIESGLKADMTVVNLIISINYDDENNIVYIEKIDLPEDWKKKYDRPLSFIEIIYQGIFSILNSLVTYKYHFFEHTHSRKAYMDCNHLMKYRKCVLISLMVLKNRLDHPKTETLERLCKNYTDTLTDKQFPNVHHYDDCFWVKLKMVSLLKPIELLSFAYFYENFTQLFQVNESLINHNYTLNKQCEPKIVSEPNEAELKEPPNYHYIDLEQIPSEYLLFPDYSYDIIQRDFYSILVRIKPKSFNRDVEYNHPNCYYKRIYLDGSCEAPLLEPEWQDMKTDY
jgi:hypothetical protein